jgi:hypothetical protein
MIDTEITVSVDQAIDYLNSLLDRDAQGITELVDSPISFDGKQIGLLSIINGLFGLDDKGPERISFVWQGGKIQRFTRAEAS